MKLMIMFADNPTSGPGFQLTVEYDGQLEEATDADLREIGQLLKDANLVHIATGHPANHYVISLVAEEGRTVSLS